MAGANVSAAKTTLIGKRRIVVIMPSAVNGQLIYDNGLRPHCTAVRQTGRQSKHQCRRQTNRRHSPVYRGNKRFTGRAASLFPHPGTYPTGTRWPWVSASDSARHDFVEIVMIRTLLAATTALTLISGVGFAQSSYSSSTTETTRMMPTPPSHDVDVTTTTKRTDTPNGVLVEKDERGSETIRPGGVAASRTTVHTETTTDR
jgi:hypothetical protein